MKAGIERQRREAVTQEASYGVSAQDEPAVKQVEDSPGSGPGWVPVN